MRNMFITLEGPEGSGKTSHIPYLVEYLREKGHTVFPTREPGGTSISEQIRDILHDLKNAEITKSLIDQTLKNDIYKAYFNASAALEKFNAAKITLGINRKSFDFAKKRFDLGLLNSFDLITSQNNMNRAEYDLASAHFDYVFKMKVLEFYKGQGIKL